MITPGASWTCPVCNRRVPGHVPQCRCGRVRRDSDTQTSATGTTQSQSAFLVKLVAAIIVATAATGAAAWYSRSRPPAPVKTTVRKPSAPLPPSIIAQAVAEASSGRPAASESAPSAPAATGEPPKPSAPPARATASDLPDSSAPPLEDMIEHAMPAIVMIETPKTRGSGFFIRPDLIVTNAHVISGYLFPTVTTRSGAKLNGKVAQLSDSFDLALVQVPRLGPTDAQLALGESSSLRLGQGIVALGWAQSLTQSTVTRGIVTGLRKDGDRLLVQTDAVPNPGDSGGPLLDRRGQVVGVTTFRADNGTSGYAVAADDLAPLVEKVTSNVMTIPSAGLAVTAARPSDSDQRRSAGLQRYTSTMAGVARNVAELDTAWSRYKSSCRVNNATPGQTHEWFQFYDPLSDIHRTTTRCADVLSDLERQAAAVNTTMTTAAEAARQAGVYPGSMREVRERYRLDYPGWDR